MKQDGFYIANVSNHLKQDGFYIANVSNHLKQDGFYIANVSNHLKQDVSTLLPLLMLVTIGNMMVSTLVMLVTN